MVWVSKVVLMFLLSLLAYRICPSYFCQAQYSFFLYGCVFVLVDASCIAILRKKCDLFYKSWWYEELGVLQAFNLWSVLGEPEIIISRRLAMFHFFGRTRHRRCRWVDVGRGVPFTENLNFSTEMLLLSTV